MLSRNEISVISCGEIQENAYLVCPDGRADAFFVDPGDDFESLMDALKKSGRTLAAILLTHGHFDHMLAAEKLQDETGAKVYISEQDMEMLTDGTKSAYEDMKEITTLPQPTHIAAEAYRESVAVCGLTIHVLPTPGHTRGSVCLYESQGGVLFSGDTLFFCAFGRTDLYGGSMMALRGSLRKLLMMPEETMVLPGHGAQTTIGRECRHYGM